ncbi:E3 ubiquitin-protein ligase TRIM39-like isoform X1 [Acanthochromis polyacanthus]|uniref:E3 ubiquitin-protein ligase TRIM39-like n=1 Tax=Acanthochromis polyacanthus TaxID=80966 RepID=A0A3Q1EWR2_9TELE|nr:E3 ubiquitin-protein ligase TRIM39-like isoform X1 [Acanthochromis polyacanthus]
MASVDVHCEDQPLCSICQDAFTEPVSTPCGHNYCKACITGYWDSSAPTQCPLCLRRFSRRPQLQVNTAFRDMVEQFSSLIMTGGNEVLVKPGEVPCDVCRRLKLKAQKTCLVCSTSYCQTHLEPHQRVERLKRHNLINPVSNLDNRVCKKHHKMLEFFCHLDQECICFTCLKDDHVAHEAVPVENVFRERKAWLQNATSEVEVVENAKSSSVQGIKHSAQRRKEDSEREIADIADLLGTLVGTLLQRQIELISLIEEKQKAAEKQAEDFITQLEQEVAELRRKRSEMEQLSQSEDHLHLLQSWPSLNFPTHAVDPLNPLSHYNPPFTPDFLDIGQQTYVGMVKKSVAEMEKALSNEMEMLIHEVRLSDGCETAKQTDAAEKPKTDGFVQELWNPPQDKLMMIQQCHAVNVTLDAYSANSKLMVSEDGKQLTFQKSGLFFPALLGRKFERQPFVIATDGFSSGRFYYEVRVSGSKCWLLGVVKESIDRLIMSDPSPEEGAWTFSARCTQFDELYRINASNGPPPNVMQRPQTVGVFVDYEKGEISFYDVDARTLLYSFTGCSFTETTPTLKAFLYSMAGSPVSSRPKLYPFFGIFEGDPDNMLIISPVSRAT